MMNLSTKIKAILIFCLFTFSLANSNTVYSCPADPPKAFVWHVVVAGDNNSNLQFEIDGYSAIGSEEGDSCAAAVVLPVGIKIESIEMVDSRTGRPVGFGDFVEDSAATFGFCPTAEPNCFAFTTKVEKTIPSKTSLKMIINAVSDSGTDNRTVTQTALAITRTGMVIAGGVDDSGGPNHHLSIMRPYGTKLEFAHK